MYPSSFRTLAIAILTFDEGIVTTARSTICALRMRVSMSAIGSVMLIGSSLLPARLDDAGNLVAHRIFAKLVAAQTELAENAARTTRQRAAIAKPRRIGVARQLLQLEARCEAVFVGHFRVFDDGNERFPPLRKLGDELYALVLPVDHCEL